MKFKKNDPALSSYMMSCAIGCAPTIPTTACSQMLIFWQTYFFSVRSYLKKDVPVNPISLDLEEDFQKGERSCDP